MLEYNTETPILFLLFNRPDTTRKIFSQIRKAKPRRLYIAADGPRAPEEQIKCEEARKITAETDWDCTVKILFRDKNLGCSKAISEAITWFFEYEPEGIILEDDCLPSDSFFGFCSALLERYRDDERIGHISGGNYQKKIVRGDGSYYFSNLTHVWGWAGWRRVWKDYDITMQSYPLFDKMKYLEKMPSHGPFDKMWDYYLKVHHAGANGWDYPYSYHNFINNRLSIIPNVNLIQNIGCSLKTSPTHYIPNHPFADMVTRELEAPLIHPSFILADIEADLYSQSLEYNRPLSPKSIVPEYMFLKDKLVSLSGSCDKELKIPKIIHQIYENKDVPEYLLKIAETWKVYHPGWDYRFWDKHTIEQFLESVYPEYISRYRAFPFDVQRWDAIRYLILYHIGGLYVDMDYECIEPLDSLLCGSSCFMGLEPAINAIEHNKLHIVGNAFMASIPGYPYFRKIIEDIFDTNDRPAYRNKPLQVMETTGPFMTTRIYDAYPSKEEIALLPAELIAPLTITEVQQIMNGLETEEIVEKIEKAFAVHYFFGSWISQTIEQQPEINL
jgi:mannosyltransferase OCH1-like enzyme